MKWRNNSTGSKIRDLRGTSRGFGGRRGGGALFSLIPMLFRFLGLKGTVVAVILGGAVFMMKPELFSMLLGGGSSAAIANTQKASSEEDKIALQLIHNTKSSTDKIWTKLLSGYRTPSLDIHTDRQGTGPYYMPSDEKIHIDPQFFIDLATRHDSPGDFAQSYVIAHESAHHIQKILALTTFVHQQHGSANYNNLSVRLELYADFLAGVWAHHAVKDGHFEMEEGDLQEAINAANNIGDDVLQKKAGAWKIDPAKFTHGTGEQRMAWLIYGVKSGDPFACKLFSMTRSGISVGQRSLEPPVH